MTNATETSSYVDGGELPPLPFDSLPAALISAARAGTGDIVYVHDDGTESRQTYAELLDRARRILTGLRLRGVQRGDKVLLQTDVEADLLAGFWACVLGGFLPVPVTAGTTPAQRSDAGRLLLDVWQMLGRPWVLSQERVAESADRWVGTPAILGDHDAATDLPPAALDDLAVLLLTSGSTGLPKAVMLSHRNILSRSVATAAVNDLHERTRTFNWMPLDHVGGLVMFHARDVVLACHQVHARLSWVLEDPLRWLDAMSRGHPTSPSA
jgi:acyl-CoA synthetase (AMP-forming)/AMP-acid ligase II